MLVRWCFMISRWNLLFYPWLWVAMLFYPVISGIFRAWAWQMSSFTGVFDQLLGIESDLIITRLWQFLGDIPAGMWRNAAMTPWNGIPQLHGWSLSMNCRDFPQISYGFSYDFPKISRGFPGFPIFVGQVPIRGTYEGVLRLRPQWPQWSLWRFLTPEIVMIPGLLWIISRWIVIWSSKYG